MFAAKEKIRLDKDLSVARMRPMSELKSPKRSSTRPLERAARRDARGFFTNTAGEPTPALIEHLTRLWNGRRGHKPYPETMSDATTIAELIEALAPDQLVDLPELMLLVARVKPAVFLDHVGPASEQLRQSYRLLAEAGFEVRVTAHAKDDGATVLIAANPAFGDVLAGALAGWPHLRGDSASEAYARALARYQRKTVELGLILGYPALSVAAYAAGDDWFFEGADNPLPWDPDTLAWWRALGRFRLGASVAALEEAQHWVKRARDRFLATFPAAQPPKLEFPDDLSLDPGKEKGPMKA
jgi:hypothetical protein